MKRNKLLDWASTFLNGLTGGKKDDVAEGVEGKTKRLYDTYRSDKTTQAPQNNLRRPDPKPMTKEEEKEAARKRKAAQEAARNSGFLGVRG